MTVATKKMDVTKARKIQADMLATLARVNPELLVTMTSREVASIPVPQDVRDALDEADALEATDTTVQRKNRVRSIHTTEQFVRVKYGYADHVVVTVREGRKSGLVFNNMNDAYNRAVEDGGEYWCNVKDSDGYPLGRLYPEGTATKGCVGCRDTWQERWVPLKSTQSEQPTESEESKGTIQPEWDVTTGTHAIVRTTNPAVTIPSTLVDYYNRNKPLVQSVRPTQRLSSAQMQQTAWTGQSAHAAKQAESLRRLYSAELLQSAIAGTIGKYTAKQLTYTG